MPYILVTTTWLSGKVALSLIFFLLLQSNGHILIHKKSAFRKNWLLNDIYVRDLTNSCDNFLTLSDFEAKFHKNVPFTTYYWIIRTFLRE